MVRSIDFDLCLPADAIEYEALGKHAVIQLVTSTAIAAELPLKSVYVDVRGVNVPLRRIWRSGVAQNGDRYEQVSFYVIPIQFTKQEGRILADFTGERRGLGIPTFGPTTYAETAEQFILLEAHANPGEAAEESTQRQHNREHAEIFKKIN